jgi:hypothetical protein
MSLSTLAQPAFGTELNLCSDANGTSPTLIASVRDINFTLSTQVEESTAHDTAEPFRTYVGCLNSVGPIEAMLNYVPDNPTHDGVTGLLAVWKARAERTYTLVETDDGGTTYEWNAVIQSMKMGRPFAGLRTGSVTWQGTGVPDFDA